MRVAYCYIGPLPEYAIDTVHQTRLFFSGPIDFIISDLTSPCIPILRKYDVTIVPYETVRHKGFEDCIAQYESKFSYLEGLKGRERLFVYAFERFFVLYQWVIQQNLEDILFLELDNLIYNDPHEWEESFCAKEMAFMFDNYDRCASGICFIQNADVLLQFTKCCIRYISETDTSKKFMTEMQALDEFWKMEPHRVQILPTHWPSSSVPDATHENYHRYKKSIFDSAAMGIYFGGVDPFHTDGLIITGLISIWSAINYTHYQFEWRTDEKGRLIPYVYNDSYWVRINNLHIHSKILGPHVSKDIIHSDITRSQS
jgi:hypothetical protein